MLECRDLSVFYGPHLALAGVSINIKRGEIVTILGANGAGKSTLLKTISGLVDHEDESEIFIDGRSISDWDPHQIVEAGLSMVPEGRDLFGELTVLENLMLGAYPRRARGEETTNLDHVMTLFPKLAERRKQMARTMSGGEQQMVAVGRAMMSAPSILMLDEPSLGLSPLLCSELFKALAKIRKSGVGILLVEQNVKQSLAISDRGYLLETGRITGEESAEVLANDQAVLRAYLGGITRLESRWSERLSTREILKSNIHDLIKHAEQRQSDHITTMRLRSGDAQDQQRR
ncbi:MAG TPA: ABC transporter ATP-binding protein [Gammaproteobacteria bacterium]|nr:ABC transporter ATP-binding protein [Gammaproteobacteria bacterium]